MSGGFRVTKDNRAKIKAQAREACALALEDTLGELLRLSNQTVPQEEGILEGSGEVEVDAASLNGQVSYGGEAGAYALRQHEETGWSHDGNRRAKWLELTFRENASRVGAMLTKALKGAFG